MNAGTDNLAASNDNVAAGSEPYSQGIFDLCDYYDTVTQNYLRMLESYFQVCMRKLNNLINI